MSWSAIASLDVSFSWEFPPTKNVQDPMVECFVTPGRAETQETQCLTLRPNGTVLESTHGPVDFCDVFAVRTDFSSRSFLKLSLSFAGGQTPTTTTLALPVADQGKIDRDTTALCFDLYVHEPCTVDNPTLVTRRRAAATFLLADLLSPNSHEAPFLDHAMVEEPEELASGKVAPQTWGRVRVSVHLAAPSAVLPPPGGHLPFPQLVQTLQTSYADWIKRLCERYVPDQQAYIRAAKRAGLVEDATSSNMLSPWNFVARATAAVPGHACVWWHGTPKAFRGTPEWLLHQIEVAFARRHQKMRPLELTDNDAGVLAEACAAWVSSHLYTDDRNLGAKGEFVPGDAYYNSFVQSANDCEDSNGTIVAVFAHFCVTDFSQLPPGTMRTVLQSAHALAKLYVPFLCIGASQSAFSAGGGPMKNVKLGIHCYGLAVPLHRVVEGLGVDVAQLAQPIQEAAKQSKNVRTKVLEGTGWVDSGMDELIVPLARRRLWDGLLSCAALEKVGGVPEAVALCVRESLVWEKDEVGPGRYETRAAPKMHLMVTSLMSPLPLRWGLVEKDETKQTVAFRPTLDAVGVTDDQRTWSVPTRAFLGDEKVRLEPLMPLAQDEVELALAFERPVPEMRLSQAKQEAKARFLTNMVDWLVARQQLVRVPGTDALVLDREAVGRVTPLAVAVARAQKRAEVVLVRDEALVRRGPHGYDDAEVGPNGQKLLEALRSMKDPPTVVSFAPGVASMCRVTLMLL